MKATSARFRVQFILGVLLGAACSRGSGAAPSSSGTPAVAAAPSRAVPPPRAHTPMSETDRAALQRLARFIAETPAVPPAATGDAEAEPTLDPDRFAEAFVAGLGELTLEGRPQCAEWFQRVGELNNRVDSGRRIEREAGALLECGPCAPALRALATMPRDQRTASAATSRCPGDGLVAPALGARGAQVHGVDYLYVRMLLERTQAAVEADGSDAVRASWEQIRQSIPRLITGLVRWREMLDPSA